MHFYKRLSKFFSEHFPEIKIAFQLEKDILIKELKESQNFLSTHKVIAKLSGLTNFSEAQINDIADAYIENNQVNLILEDPDVNDFLAKMMITGKVNDDKMNIIWDLLEAKDLLRPF